MRLAGIISIMYITLVVLAIIGEVKCIIKFVQCDFKAPYKAEVIYGVGTITGLGAVVGWIDINNNPEIKPIEKNSIK